MYEQIFGRSNLPVLNRALANAKLDIQLDDITIHIIWLSYSHYTRPPEKPEGTRSAPHRHSFFEMHLFLRGSSVYEARDAEYAVQEGELLFLGKEVPHQFQDGSQEWDKISLAFDITSRSSPTAARALKALTFSDALVTRYDPAILTCFNVILSEADAQELCYLEAIKARLVTIVIALVRTLASRQPKTAADKPPSIDSRIAEIDAYVQGHMQELVTLADIAQHIHISTKQINRILQRDFSLSRRDYIDRIKCEHAKDLLLHTDMPLDEIATAIGYANVFSFNKFFRRVEGLPPGLFRRSHYSY